jgi:hypothetical protein
MNGGTQNGCGEPTRPLWLRSAEHIRVQRRGVRDRRTAASTVLIDISFPRSGALRRLFGDDRVWILEALNFLLPICSQT